MENLGDKEKTTESDRRRDFQKETIIAYFMLALVWSVGASSTQKSCKEKFNHFFRSLCTNSNKKYPRPNDLIISMNSLIPKSLTIYDYTYDYSAKGEWITWYSMVENEKIPADVKVKTHKHKIILLLI